MRFVYPRKTRQLQPMYRRPVKQRGTVNAPSANRHQCRNKNNTSLAEPIGRPAEPKSERQHDPPQRKGCDPKRYGRMDRHWIFKNPLVQAVHCIPTLHDPDGDRHSQKRA